MRAFGSGPVVTGLLVSEGRSLGLGCPDSQIHGLSEKAGKVPAERETARGRERWGGERDRERGRGGEREGEGEGGRGRETGRQGERGVGGEREGGWGGQHCSLQRNN